MQRRPVTTEHLIYLRTEKRLSAHAIGLFFGMTRQGVLLRLKRAGIKPSSHEKVTVNCSYCEKPLTRHRCKVRKNMRNFCSMNCYALGIANPRFVEWRQGTRIARAAVSKYFDLKPEYRVHHKDGNERNNSLENLAVFATQADHIAYHRGRKVEPIWNGESIKHAA
jgi:endogenous inhibitor of DNA gyrase (YacG/DUF329 family)